MPTTNETFISRLEKSSPPWPLIQQQAIRAFSQTGIPNVKMEEWKYTSLSSLLASDFDFDSKPRPLNQHNIKERLPFLQNNDFILVSNGLVTDALTKRPDGIEFISVDRQISHPVFEKHFSKYADLQKDSFAALNTGLAASCLMIHIPENVKSTVPINIVLISSSSGPSAFIPVRLLLVSGKHSQASVSIIQLSASAACETFSNPVTEIFVDEHARLGLEWVQLENSQSSTISSLYAESLDHSVFKVNTLTLGGKLTRNKLQIRLNGPGSEAYFNGLYLPEDRMHVDNHTTVIHSKPHCTSNQNYKGIISGYAHGVFCGRIAVEPDAQKTQAYQSNKNILIGNNAVVNSKPQLEIFADDVKCTHGATTGQLDSNALFYLRARGIDEPRARALLEAAFAADILQQVSDDGLRSFLTHRIEKRFIS